MVQPSLDPRALSERFAELRAEAECLVSAAVEMRATSRHYCMKNVAERRGATIRAIWRSRQLRYDKHGRVLAMWTGDERSPDDRLASRNLDDAVNALFRVSLMLSGIAASLHGPERQRMLTAIIEMDELIRDIRQIALDRHHEYKIGKPESALWLARVREATSGIDQLVASAAAPVATFDLREASQAAHRAIIALGEAS